MTIAPSRGEKEEWAARGAMYDPTPPHPMPDILGAGFASVEDITTTRSCAEVRRELLKRYRHEVVHLVLLEKDRALFRDAAS